MIKQVQAVQRRLYAKYGVKHALTYVQHVLWYDGRLWRLATCWMPIYALIKNLKVEQGVQKQVPRGTRLTAPLC